MGFIRRQHKFTSDPLRRKTTTNHTSLWSLPYGRGLRLLGQQNVVNARKIGESLHTKIYTTLLRLHECLHYDLHHNSVAKEKKNSLHFLIYFLHFWVIKTFFACIFNFFLLWILPCTRKKDDLLLQTNTFSLKKKFSERVQTTCAKPIRNIIPCTT